jgi:hypothetical protein
MHLLRGTLTVATHVGAITTTVAAQSTASPAPTPNDPNTKVYAYRKTAPGGKSSSHAAIPGQMARDSRGSASRLAEVVERGESLGAG